MSAQSTGLKCSPATVDGCGWGGGTWVDNRLLLELLATFIRGSLSQQRQKALDGATHKANDGPNVCHTHLFLAESSVKDMDGS